MHHGLGSVQQLLDSTGQIAAKCTYDRFGVPLPGGAVPNPWRFAGEAWDAEVEILCGRISKGQPQITVGAWCPWLNSTGQAT